jgi:hypothetical protein
MASSEDQQLRAEIGVEREKLVDAVTTLRAEFAKATDVRGQVKAHLPVIVASAAGITFVKLGGIGRTYRLITRR